MRLAWVVIPLAMLGLTACVSVGPQPDQTPKTTVVTPTPAPTYVTPAPAVVAPGTTVITHP